MPPSFKVIIFFVFLLFVSCSALRLQISDKPFLPVAKPRCLLENPNSYDYAQLTKDLKKRARRGEIHAQALLGRMYFEGTVLERGARQIANHQEAYFWLNKALLKNHPISHFYMGYYYLRDEFHKKDLKRSKKWFLRAESSLLPLAEKGDSEAQVLLGKMLEKNLASHKNLLKAQSWYCRSAKKGNPRAMYLLGNIFYQMERSLRKEGLYLVQEAANREDASAQYFLGNYFLEKKKVNKAISWFQKAAENHYAGAQYELGRIFKENPRLNRTQYDFAQWFHLASEQNQKNAQVELAKVFLADGSERENLIYALRWLFIARKNQGFPDPTSMDVFAIAQDLVEKHEGLLTPDEHSQAKNFSDDWRPVYMGGSIGP